MLAANSPVAHNGLNVWGTIAGLQQLLRTVTHVYRAGVSQLEHFTVQNRYIQAEQYYPANTVHKQQWPQALHAPAEQHQTTTISQQCCIQQELQQSLMMHTHSYANALSMCGASSSGLSHSRHALQASSMQWQRHYTRPCSDSVEEERFSMGAAAMHTTCSAAAGQQADNDDSATQTLTSEAVTNCRRSGTESRAVLRRTTESRLAIEDVSVMTKSQLMRRNKPWLKEQCWSRKLPHDGRKDELVQHLLSWQTTDDGKAAAAAAQVALAAARKAAAELQATDALQASSSPADDVEPAEQAISSAPNVTALQEQQNHSSSRRRRRRSTNTAAVSGGISEPPAAVGNVSAAQPPINAAEAASDTVTALLQQLQCQPDNAALVAATRNSLETYVQGLLLAHQHSSSNTSSDPGQLVAGLSAKISANSSPQSIAKLAEACYSREVQDPVLAAAMSEAVAAVAKHLGPLQVYRVLRLLAEHLDSPGSAGSGASSGTQGPGFKILDKGFNVLVEGFIGCSEALAPMQLAEAIELLWQRKYDDPYGLWMICKEAAARLHEFAPSDVVVLLDAVAGMCVADDALCADVAAVVAARREAYTVQQLEQVVAALRRMGYTKEMVTQGPIHRPIPDAYSDVFLARMPPNTHS